METAIPISQQRLFAVEDDVREAVEEHLNSIEELDEDEVETLVDIVLAMLTSAAATKERLEVELREFYPQHSESIADAVWACLTQYTEEESDKEEERAEEPNQEETVEEVVVEAPAEESRPEREEPAPREECRPCAAEPTPPLQLSSEKEKEKMEEVTEKPVTPPVTAPGKVTPPIPEKVTLTPPVSVPTAPTPTAPAKPTAPTAPTATVPTAPTAALLPHELIGKSVIPQQFQQRGALSANEVVFARVAGESTGFSMVEDGVCVYLERVDRSSAASRCGMLPFVNHKVLKVNGKPVFSMGDLQGFSQLPRLTFTFSPAPVARKAELPGVRQAQQQQQQQQQGIPVVEKKV